MSQQLLVLGLKASEKLIDDHFDKLPDQIFRPRQSLREIRDRVRGNKRSEVDPLKRRSDLNSDRGEPSRPAGKTRSRGSDIKNDSLQRGRVSQTREGDTARSSRSDPYWKEAERRTRRHDRNLAAGYYSRTGDPRYPAQQRDPTSSRPLPPPSLNPYQDPGESYSTQRRSRPVSHHEQRGHVEPSRPDTRKRPSSLRRGTAGLGDKLSRNDRGLGAGGLAATEVGRKRRGDPAMMPPLGSTLGGPGTTSSEGRYARKDRKRVDSHVQRKK